MDIERERIRKEIFDKSDTEPKEQTIIPRNILEEQPEINPELLKMFPPERLERIKKKELRKYKASQGKKWRNYLESVSK